jgi:hypothetical protein
MAAQLVASRAVLSSTELVNNQSNTVINVVFTIIEHVQNFFPLL